jgi:hypothetical protein
MTPTHPTPAIPEETRRLFLAAMEAEASGYGGFAQSLRALLRLQTGPRATLPLPEPQKAVIEAKTPVCPVCGSDELSARHHSGSFLAPECHFEECDECGHQFNQR